eukprot:Seg1497.1 transcript_id=Seg1497.1/GoldUCD/mRNA.D3Y31 product="Patatin-like phospholipase domain-containing protein 7" protein_id=Seg1497.1/GoldUCD/D3Y31
MMDNTKELLQGLGQLPVMNIIIPLVITTLVIVICCLAFARKVRNKEQVSNSGKPKPNPRFRKRDKMMFYGRKIFRKVNEFKNGVLFDVDEGKLRRRRSTSSFRRRVLFPPFAQRFLHRPQAELIRLQKDIPASALEADDFEVPGFEPQLPAEIMYMLRSVRVFGNFEKPLFFELCKHIESKHVPAGTLLFRPGQMDDCLYIVQSGQLNLYLVDKTGNELCLKTVNAGDNIHSVLHILDAIRGSADFRFSIIARANVNSQVLKLPSKAFQKVFEDHADSLVRIVQIIMVRLQQVTFEALNRFLGLKSELISAANSQKVNAELRKSFSVYSLKEAGSKTSQKESPLKKFSSSSKGPVSPIEEYQDDNGDGDTPIRRTVSFTNSVEVMGEAKVESEQQPTDVEAKIKRTRSSERFNACQRNRRRSTAMSIRSLSIDTGTSPSDFEVALGRAGIELTGSAADGSFQVGSPESSPTSDSDITFKFPSHVQSTAENTKFLSVDPREEEIMKKAAVHDLSRIFGLTDPALLDDILTLACVPNGCALVQEGDKDCSLYFLVQGSLKIIQKADNEEQTLYSAYPGELVGSLALLTGESSFFTIKAEKKSYIIIISKIDFYNLLLEQPSVVIPVAYEIIKRLSSFVRNIDFALDWMVIDAGKSLYRQGDRADSVYIILNGRLRSVYVTQDGKKQLGDEYGRGEFVGLVEVLTESSRVSDVLAVRDTELAKIPDGLLNTIKLQYPQVVTRLIHLLGDRMLGNFKKSVLPKISDSKLERISPNLGTIAVIPASTSVPIGNFTFELSLALNEIGPTLLLNSDLIKKRLGVAALDSLHEYYLSNWLGQQEEIHRIVVYQSDSWMSEWTKRCIRQADAILIVCLGDGDPHSVGVLEAELERMTFVRAQKDLILLYREEHFEQPSGTVEWLNARGWISAHHHVRCPKKVFSRRNLAHRFAQDANYEVPGKTSDFSRLARRLTGTSIGLVLGGGGARGFAHVGIIKALEEAGIPIDMVGGTSMGAFIGALYAEDANAFKLIQRSRNNSKEMSSITKKLFDLTYPHTSLFSGRSFNKEISDVFGEKIIEDMLLPYFCISTDITSSRMKVHQTGCVWRYVRASMSLAGYLPPLCDPADGNLLLDGGYVNNLPADVMRSLGAKTIIAVDVGSVYESHQTNYGDSLSGWWMLWNKWNPFASSVKIPDMNEIQSRLAYVSCVQQLEEVKNSSYCHYVRPPIDNFKTLQFGSFEEIMVGVRMLIVI